VPEEISPLVGSLNDMLARLSHTIDMQKRFIADAAHQMKTPLAGMRMQSELALRQVDPDEIHRSLEQLAKSSESATRLVNQLLALARAENQPHAGLALEPLDLSAGAQRGAGLGAGLVRARDRPRLRRPGRPVEIAGSAHDAARAAVEPDRQRAALHAGGRQRHGARAQRRRPGPARSRGHRPRHRAGERAARVRALLPHPRLQRVRLSGLGLAIVREIAQQHGAEIDIFNNPRSIQKKYPGSLFRLTFPPPPPRRSPMPIDSAPPLPTAPSRPAPRERILAAAPRTGAHAPPDLVLLVLWLATGFGTVFFARDLAACRCSAGRCPSTWRRRAPR
jgi:two-component system sensor histidine kinase TctE